MKNAYQYYRYSSPDNSYTNMAEILFFEKDSISPTYGKPIGIEGSQINDGRHGKEAVFDGDALTFFDSPLRYNSWVGMDFGKEIDVDRIVYLPRSDGNIIEIGDQYELVYWNNNSWQSLGKKVADNVFLTYGNCPTNALFLLHNHTKGQEERIFTYENGEQVWW